MKKPGLAFILFLTAVRLTAQPVLDDYIKYGIEHNLALKQKLAGYEMSIEALRQARGLFYPDLSLNARYTVAEGGRVIDFPVGDLLNPVYATLNAITASSMFPVLENQEIRFLRPHEQETKLRLIQPVINTDIYYNTRIRKDLVTFNKEDASQYERELRAEIKKAYYNAAMADKVLFMLKETRKLLAENVRVNRKLAENNMVTLDYIYRSEAELSKFDQELQNSGKNRKTAFAWFNFLLNKPLNDSIIITEPDVYPSLSDLNQNYMETAVENREELKKLAVYSNISDMKIRMNNADRIPDMYVAIDYGFEGTEYRFNSDHDYVLASAILSWNLFSGFRNRSETRQAVMEKQMADQKLEEVRHQIELQVINALNELVTAEKGIEAAEARLKNAREGFRLVNRRYEEGQSSLIEFIDSRTELTRAEENLIISRFSYLSTFAEFEKATAVKTNE